MTKRIQLVIEELFTNSILHGHETECDSSIELTFNVDAKRIKLTYSDCAKPFDLLTAQPLPTSTERIGGVGLNLVRAMTSAIRYRHANGRNIIDLEFPV